jgi:copper(I)-binding protein
VSRAAHPAQTPAAEPRSGARRRLLIGVPAGIALGALVLTGCGAGQITQTDTQVAAVNGASGNAGAISVRNVELAYPGGTGAYTAGASADLTLTIVNTGGTADTLTQITTPAATSVLIDGKADGTKPLPGGFAVSGGKSYDDNASAPMTTTTTEQTTTTAPSAPATTGKAPASGGNSASGSQTTGAVPTGAPGSTAPSSTGNAAVPSAPGQITVTLQGLKTVNGSPLRAGLTIPITFRFANSGEVTIYAPIGAPADDQNPDTVIASIPNGS